MAKRTERSAELGKPPLRRAAQRRATTSGVLDALGLSWADGAPADAELYRTVAETATDPIVTIDDAGVILFANRAAERTFGHAREALLGQPLTIVMPADVRDRQRQSIQRRIRMGKRRLPQEAFEMTGLHRDGRSIPLEVSFGHFTQGRRHLFAGIMRDLTGRRRTERRLAVQYAATRSLAESATLREATRRILQAIGETLGCLVGAIWTVDRARQELRCVEQWHARSASVRAFEAMSRRIALAKGEGLPGRVWADGEPVWIPDVVDDPNFPRIATARREGLHAGFAFPIRLGGEVLGVVEFFSREIEQPDHELLQMTEALGSQIGQFMERRRVEEAARELLAREQAARTAAEAAERRAAFLAEAERLLASSLDFETTLSTLAALAVPDLADWCSVDVLEVDGSIRRIAVAHVDPMKADLARKVRGYPSDPAGRHPRTRVLRTGRAELFPDITEDGLAAVAGSPEHFEVMRQLGYRSCMIVPLVARGRSFGALTFVTAESGRRYGQVDLSLAQELAARAALAVDNARLYREAQEALTQAERANRAKDEFLATVSHELRTPLSAVLLWTRLMARGSLDEGKKARALDLIERNAKLQAQLVEDLLDVSRIISGKLHLEVRPMDLAAVVEAALDAIRPAADAKAIRMDSSLAPGAEYVAGDPSRLQQVIWNLLSNAIKFTPKGGRVDVDLRRAESHVELTVRDTGEGISAEFLPHIFERFRQADSTSTRAHGGLGLGLGIVRHLVELHGGTVRAESPGRGGGSTFVVSLPLPAVRGPFARPEATAAPELSLDELPALDGVRVLVVDDQPDARAALALILQQRQASVTAVGSVAEAVDVFAHELPDVLLSDIAMPGEDGFSLIRRVRGLPGGRNVPAAALTAFASRDDRMRVLLAGYQTYLVKPVEPAELVAVIANLAGRTGAR